MSVAPPQGWAAEGAIAWPEKHPVLGVPVSATDYDELVHLLLRAAWEGIPVTVDHLSVHGLAEANRDASFAVALKEMDVVAPDGQPVRWALDRIHGTGLAERVYGPELMARLCEGAAREGIGVYLYGSRPEVLRLLREKLVERFPELRVAGSESPPFRTLSDEEDRAVVERIQRSGAGLVFIGLGCPKQERFAHEHRDHIQAVQLCVGAAFDFHAGVMPMAPPWMQERGLEWLFRLASEPRRLFRRYLVSNTWFLIRMVRELGRRAARSRDDERAAIRSGEGDE